jgi:predicted dehydrogenase
MTISSAEQTLKVGVIGLGFAGTTHLDAYQKLANVEVVALAGKEVPRLHELGTTRGVPNLYEDWEDLVARDDLDIVSIGTPNFLHAPIAVAALGSGKHVLCEKPLATSGDEAAKMVEAAQQANRVLEIAFNHRRRGDVQLLRQYIESGALGRIYHAKSSWLRRQGIPGLGSWFTNKAMAGGGPLIDLGAHVLDIALFLMGEPRVLSASCATYNELGTKGIGGSTYGGGKSGGGSAYEVEDLASAFLRLEGGGTLILEASWAGYGKAVEDVEVELMGTEGGAQIFSSNYSQDHTLKLFTDVIDQPAITVPNLPPPGRHQQVVAEFVDIVRGGNWSAHTGVYGLHRTRVLDACYASALQGREVAVEPDLPADA